MEDARTRSRLSAVDCDLIENRVRVSLRLRMEGRRAEAAAYYAPGFVLDMAGPAALRPWIGRFEGAEQMERLRRDILVEFELIDHEILDLAVAGDICLVRRRVTYRNRGAGAPETFFVWERYRFENGLIADIQHQADPLALARLTGRLSLLAAETAPSEAER